MQNPWKVILAFVGVFIAGAVFGGLLALRIGRAIISNRPAVAAPAQGDRPAGGDAGTTGAPSPAAPQAVQRAQLMRRITNHLDLTPVQRDRIDPIINRALQDVWRAQQNFSRESVFLLQRLKQDIGKELLPEQQKRLDELWQKQMEALRRRQLEAQAQRQATGRPAAGERGAAKAPGVGDAKPASTTPTKPASDSPAQPATGTGK